MVLTEFYLSYSCWWYNKGETGVFKVVKLFAHTVNIKGSVMTYHLKEQAQQKITAGFTAFVFVLTILFASITPQLLGLMTASAAPNGDRIVRNASNDGWTTNNASGGTNSFISDATAPYGSGALQLTTNGTNPSRAQRTKSISPSVPLSTLSTLSYHTKYVSGPVHAGAALQITINGLTGTSSSTTLVYEPYWNGTVDTLGAWQQWNTLSTGKFWSTTTVAGFVNGAGGPPFYTIPQVLASHPNAKVTSVKLNIGTYNPDWVVRADGVNFNGTVYDFEPAADPVLTGENFNTHSGADYKGVNVGFRINDDFGTVSAVKVELYKDTTKLATNTHNTALLSLINSGARQLSTPFITEPGTYIEDYWNLGAHSLGLSTKPTKAVVTVTGVNGTRSTEISPLVEPNGWTYESIIPLAVPTLLSPTNNATINGTTLTNSWDTVEGATKYQYQSFHDAAGTNLRWDETFAATSKTATNVPNGTTFWWQVRALDNTGKASEWSPRWKVTIDNNKPSIPTNGQPHNAVLTTNNFYFTWDASTDASAVTYEFQSSQESSRDANNVLNGSNVWKSDVLSSNTIHSTGAPDGVWYWQVRAVDAAGNKSDWSQIWNVTLDTQTPSVPVLSTPANNGFVTTQDFTFDWQDSTGTGVTYEWEASYSNATNPDGSFVSRIVLHTLSDSTVPSPGTPDNAYYWHVRAKSVGGHTSAWSETWKTTVDTQAPAAVAGLSFTSPAVSCGGFTNSYNITASWNSATDSAGIAQYEYWVVTPVRTEASAWTTTVGVNQYVGAFTEGEGAYTFKVRSQDNAGNWSAWSEICSITYDATAPLVSFPNNGSTFASTATPSVTVTETNTPLTYSWQAVAPALQSFISDPTAAQPVFTVNTDGTYAFDLTITDAAGNTATERFSFTRTTPPVPPVPTVTSPIPTQVVANTAAPQPAQAANVQNQANQGTQVVTDDEAETTEGQTLGTNNANDDDKEDQGLVESANTTASTQGSWVSNNLLWIILALVGAGILFALWRRRSQDQA